jgi:hypothetical protein
LGRGICVSNHTLKTLELRWHLIVQLANHRCGRRNLVSNCGLNASKPFTNARAESSEISLHVASKAVYAISYSTLGPVKILADCNLSLTDATLQMRAGSGEVFSDCCIKLAEG